jgi:excinuclease UvrABC helicase subunit UvrB
MAEDLTEYFQERSSVPKYLQWYLVKSPRSSWIEIYKIYEKVCFDVLIGVNLLREGLRSLFEVS